MATAAPPAPTTAPPAEPAAPAPMTWWLPLAALVALVGVIGSLYLSLGMELKACPLCFYQRSFIMATLAVLAFGLFIREIPRGAVTPLALGPAMAGAYIAVMHVNAVYTGALECPI